MRELIFSLGAGALFAIILFAAIRVAERPNPGLSEGLYLKGYIKGTNLFIIGNDKYRLGNGEGK